MTKAETEVESVKRSSNFLRGELAQELRSDSPSVSNESEHILKFHGVYAQDNRDVRRERAQAGDALDYIFMTRVVIPGGRLSSEQWLALDAVAEDLADGSIRLTTRQAVQFHGTIKSELRPLAESLDAYLLSSFGGCGDVVRNVVMCPHLPFDPRHTDLDTLASSISTRFRPKTLAHWEIFVDGKVAASRESDDEQPFYGDTYLPRKFKIAIAHPEENCVDVFAQDVGLIPITLSDGQQGFTVLVGGGLGRSYANPDTFAHLAVPLTTLPAVEIDELIAAILSAYKDLGDRTDRKRARMKYIVADHGIDFFRAEVESRLGRSLPDPRSLPTSFAGHDHLGWEQQPDGSWNIGIRIPAGRVRDSEASQVRTALRALASGLRVSFVLTPQQDLIVTGIASDEKNFVAGHLASHGVRLLEELGRVERSALACPALPTCSQALAESERVLSSLVSDVENTLEAHAPQRQPLQLRLTGCPNGCARPAVAEVGVVGRTKSTYDVYVGGGPRGDRLAVLLREKVKLAEVGETLAPLFQRWSAEGLPDEAFGDFVSRAGLS